MKAFRKHRQSKKLKAGKLLSSFLKDSAALFHFQRMIKLFMSRVKRTQRYWGSYTQITVARLQLMTLKWEALENEAFEKKKTELMKRFRKNHTEQVRVVHLKLVLSPWFILFHTI
jgi:hypothetical protein